MLISYSTGDDLGRMCCVLLCCCPKYRSAYRHAEVANQCVQGAGCWGESILVWFQISWSPIWELIETRTDGFGNTEQNCQRLLTAVVHGCCCSFLLLCDVSITPSRIILLFRRAQNQRAASYKPLSGNCAPGCWTIECLKVFLLLEMYRWVYQVMLRCYLSVIWDECQKCTSPMDVQKNVGEFLFFLGCFSELGRHFNGLHASPRCEWIDCISHCAIVCCPNHISVGQRRKCWLIIQHGSPSSPETTKSGLWLMFSVNSLMAPTDHVEVQLL